VARGYAVLNTSAGAHEAARVARERLTDLNVAKSPDLLASGE